MSSAALPAADAKPVAPSRVAFLFTSSIGLKAVMAITGIVLTGFVLVHMLGNLTAFAGAPALDAYAAALRKVPALLWGARATLLVSVILHIWAYLVLTRRSWAARPQGYRVTAYQESNYASRTMRLSGPFLLAFIVYHILHFTTGTVHHDFIEGAVYHNLVTGLQVTWIASVYLLAMAALAFHLYHGVWSLFQTLGWSQPHEGSFGRRFATLYTLIVCLGFALVPLSVLAGILK